MGVGVPIGKFEIGVSPIGAGGFYWVDTLISQYANSPTLYRWLSMIGENFDFVDYIDQFFSYIWDVDTARGYGLDIWGRIVGVSRILTLSDGGKFFGFEEAGNSSADPFNQAPFFAGVNLTTNLILSDDAFRTLIIAKALANICDGSIKALNLLLMTLYPGRGNIYVTTGLDMTMTITSTFALTDVEIAILTTSGVFPRTTGVSLSLITP